MNVHAHECVCTYTRNAHRDEEKKRVLSILSIYSPDSEKTRSCVWFDMYQGMRLYPLCSVCEDVFVFSTSSWCVMYAEAVRVCVGVRAYSGSNVDVPVIYGVGF